MPLEHMTGRGWEVGGTRPSGGRGIYLCGGHVPLGENLILTNSSICGPNIYENILRPHFNAPSIRLFQCIYFFVGEGVGIKTRSFHYAHT